MPLSCKRIWWFKLSQIAKQTWGIALQYANSDRFLLLLKKWVESFLTRGYLVGQSSCVRITEKSVHFFKRYKFQCWLQQCIHWHQSLFWWISPTRGENKKEKFNMQHFIQLIFSTSLLCAFLPGVNALCHVYFQIVCETMFKSHFFCFQINEQIEIHVWCLHMYLPLLFQLRFLNF